MFGFSNVFCTQDNRTKLFFLDSYAHCKRPKQFLGYYYQKSNFYDGISPLMRQKSAFGCCLMLENFLSCLIFFFYTFVFFVEKNISTFYNRLWKLLNSFLIFSMINYKIIKFCSLSYSYTFHFRVILEL